MLSETTTAITAKDRQSAQIIWTARRNGRRSDEGNKNGGNDGKREGEVKRKEGEGGG